MQFLNRIFKQISTHLAGLGPTQKMLIGLCVLVIVISLAWLVQWSGEPQMVYLIDQDLSPQEQSDITAELTGRGVKFRVVNDRVLVPAGRKDSLLMALNQANALPQDISVGFERLFADESPWRSDDESRWRRDVALGNELARVISTSKQFNSARVFIDRKSRRRLGGVGTPPTASIHVEAAPGVKLDKTMVHGLAMLVARSVSGLEIHNVAVYDSVTARSYRVPDPKDSIAFDLVDVIRQYEQLLKAKLDAQLNYIPGVLASVAVELDTDKKKEELIKYGRPVPSKEKKETTSSTKVSQSAEPGVAANTQVALGASTGTPTESMSSEIEDTEFELERDRTLTVIEGTPYTVKGVKASISIPRSFFINVYKSITGKDEPPDGATLQKLMNEEFDKVRKLVVNAILAKDVSDVEVNYYNDMSPEMAAAALGVAGDLSMLAMAREYAGQVGLAALAVVSLIMMGLIARKAGGEEVKLQRGESARGKPSAKPGLSGELDVLELPVGEAATTESVLVGKELEPEVLKARQFAGQVTDLVNEEPETAAEIIKKWVEKES